MDGRLLSSVGLRTAKLMETIRSAQINGASNVELDRIHLITTLAIGHKNPLLELRNNPLTSEEQIVQIDAILKSIVIAETFCKNNILKAA